MLNYCVRNGNRWNHLAIVTRFFKRLLSQNYTEEKLVTNISNHGGQCQPIIFALQARFLGHLALHKRFACKQACGSLFITYEAFTNQLHPPGSLLRCFSNKISPRHISTGPLHMLPRFYSQPICLVFFKVSY